MVKVSGPLMSETARGNLEKKIIYTKIKGVNVVKKYNPAKDEWTVNRTIERNIFQQGAAKWKTLSQEEKDEYNERAKGRALTGYNIYIDDFIKEERKKLKWARYGVGKYDVNTYAGEE